MTEHAVPAPATWAPTPPTRVRGTLAVIGGRGESTRVYERFGRRLAADGYAVGVFEAADADVAVDWLAQAEISPRVLVGSDAGAAAVLAALVGGAEAEGAILAGTPVGSGQDEGPDATARTACPVHLGVLADASSRTARTVAPVLPDRGDLSDIPTAVLSVHGGADPIADPDAAAAYLSPLAALEVVETVGGLHDALNDQSHRSVAAHIVLWLERLRAGDVTRPIVRVSAGVAA